MEISYNQEQISQTEIRKVQAIHGNSTFTLVLPKDFVSVLNISKGDYLKCKILDNQLVIEKADI
jgi:antitoxin component of MazEF toxin-antitoxin module